MAYASDSGFLSTAHLALRIEGHWQSSASLDHTIWFHRSGRSDDWVLHDFQGHGVVGGRGLTVGQIYSRQGIHMATVAQEILIRERTR